MEILTTNETSTPFSVLSPANQYELLAASLLAGVNLVILVVFENDLNAFYIVLVSYGADRVVCNWRCRSSTSVVA